MSRPHRSSRVDLTHTQIMDGLRKAGIAVRSTAGVGDGFPDAVAAVRGVNIVLEFKSPGGALTAGQRAFIDSWPGPVFVVSSAEEAILRCVEAARPR